MTTTPTIWRTHFTANTATTGAQFNPYTIGLSNGNFLTVWTDDTSGTSAGLDVFGQIFGPEGDPFGTAFQVNNSFFADGEFLGSIAPQTDGGFVIAYVDDNSTAGTADDAIRVERYDAAGTPSLITSITGAAGAVSDPEITVAPDGSYMISFTRDTAGGLDIRAVVVSAGNVVSAEFDAVQNSAGANTDSDSAGLSNNNFITVCVAADSVTGIATGTEPRVAALTGGGLAVVWNDPADNSDIRFSIFDSANVNIADQVLVAGGANVQNEPQVIHLLDGGFFVLWDDDTSGNLTGQRFSATGVAIGSNVIVDSSGGTITEPELGLTSDGRILVTYTDAAGEISQAILDPRDNGITGTAGNDVLTTQITDTTLFAGSGNDTVFGQGGNDTIVGNTGNDTIFGGSGNDLIQWINGDGTDVVDGETGIDTQQLSMSTGATGDVGQITVVGASAVFARTNFGPFSVTTTNVERIDFQGFDGDDSLTFGSLAGTSVTLVLFSGGTGNDTLSAAATSTPISADGSDGNDTIVTGSGNDTIFGGAGLDLLHSGAGNDILIDDNGASSDMNGEAGDDTMYGGTGNDYMVGSTGNDTVVGGGDGQDSLYGGDGNDYIVAADGDNNGVGSVLDGGLGSNQLYVLVGLGNDYAVGGELIDIIATGAGSDFIFGNAGDDTIVAGTGTDYIYGNAGNDFIYTDDLITNSQDFVYVSGLAGFGTGVDTVADFTPGTGGDVAVILQTPGVTTFADVQARMSDVGVYTVINLSATDQLFLYNVDPFQLNANNFIFL